MSNHISKNDNLWDSVTILRKKHNKSRDKLNAQRSGNTEIIKKNSGIDSQINTIKLDQSTEVNKHKTISLEESRKIINGRVNKKWSRQILANNINEKLSVVSDYETGKAIVDNKILNKIEKNLNIKIRNKKIIKNNKK